MLTGLWGLKDILKSRQNRSKNKLVRENAVTRVRGSCTRQVMGSWRSIIQFWTKFNFFFQASDREVVWVIRIAIFGVAVLATSLSLLVNSIYSLFALCSDLVYVILFPQLCCVIYLPGANTYGSFMGYILGLILRVGGGEKNIGLKPFIKYPYYNETDGQLFPFRTLAMTVSFTTIVVVSYSLKYLFEKEMIPLKYDFLHCFKKYALEKSATGKNNKTDFPMVKKEPSEKE